MFTYMFLIALVLSPVAIEAVDPQSCASSDRMDCSTEHADLLPVDLMQNKVSLEKWVTTKEDRLAHASVDGSGVRSTGACQGDSSIWNAGYGNCQTYAGYNRNWCSYDYSGGLYAHQVCSECGSCSVAPPPPLSGSEATGLGNCDKTKYFINGPPYQQTSFTGQNGGFEATLQQCQQHWQDNGGAEHGWWVQYYNNGHANCAKYTRAITEAEFNSASAANGNGAICDTQPQANGVQWSISPEWSGSCDAVCSGLGATCSQDALDDLGLSSSNKNPDALKQAFESATGADLTCNSWNTGCSGGNCANWGLPFIHSSHFNDAICWGGDAAAPCDKVPVDGHHRRLCPCETNQAATTATATATATTTATATATPAPTPPTIAFNPPWNDEPATLTNWDSWCAFELNEGCYACENAEGAAMYCQGECAQAGCPGFE